MRDSSPYHVKYRPTDLDSVVGQSEVVGSLRRIIGSKNVNHSFLFTGPSGTGKTTLARIIADMLDCDPINVTEVDAASNTGIDAMRVIMESLRYKPFGHRPNKFIILDECHALSKSAWQSTLKTVEDPPEHVYFAFCTTDGAKVPETIKTRCATYDLKSVRTRDIQDLLVRVCVKEELATTDEIIDLISFSCDGSPRQALVMLAMVGGCANREEAASILSAPGENKELIDLIRLMVSGRGFSWEAVRTILASMKDENPESVRIIIVNYLTAVILNTKGDRGVGRLLDMLHAFSKPINPSDRMAPILLAFGEFALHNEA